MDKEPLPTLINLSAIACILIQNKRYYLHDKYPQVNINNLEGTKAYIYFK